MKYLIEPLVDIKYLIEPLVDIKYLVEPLVDIKYLIEPLVDIKYLVEPLVDIKYSVDPLVDIKNLFEPLVDIKYLVDPLVYIKYWGQISQIGDNTKFTCIKFLSSSSIPILWIMCHTTWSPKWGLCVTLPGPQIGDQSAKIVNVLIKSNPQFGDYLKHEIKSVQVSSSKNVAQKTLNL
jgi:hypothetical protein